MHRWILFLTLSITFLTGCRPDVPPTLTATVTNTPPGLSRQLNLFATQTQAVALTASSQGPPGLYHTQIPGTPIPLLVETAGPFHQISRQEALIAGNVLELRVRGEGVRLLSENGISGLREGEWLGYFTGELGYPIGIDVTDRVWIAAPDGSQIYRAEPDIWYSWADRDMLMAPNPFNDGWTPIGGEFGRPVEFGLHTDSRGDLWLATDSDVRSFNGKWNVHDSQTMGMPPLAGDTSQKYAILTVQSTGEVLVGRCDWGSARPQGGGGARSFDGQNWRELADELNTGCVTAIAEDSAGDLWLARDDSLHHFDRAARRWEQIALPEAPLQSQFGYFTALTADPEDGLWVQLALCKPEGCFGDEILYRFRNGEWQPIGEPSQTGGRRILFDASKSPWLLSAGNIYQITGNTLQPITGLLVQTATNDESGNLWLVAQSTGAPTLWTER